MKYDENGGSKVETTTPVTIMDAQTLYAHWTPVTYTITYTGNTTVKASYLSIAYKPDVVSPKTYNGYSLTYAGEPQQPTVYTRADVKGSTSATWKYSTYAGGYAATMPSFTDAGTYTVHYEVTAPGHNSQTGRFDVVVNRAREARVSLSKDQFSYTGREQGPRT